MDMNEIKEIFFQECEEQLAELESGLLKLNDGDRDPETVNAVFRAVHSIKGGAGAFGLDDLVSFAHVFETTLDCVRSNKLEPNQEVLKVMLKSADVLADLVSASRVSLRWVLSLNARASAVVTPRVKARTISSLFISTALECRRALIRNVLDARFARASCSLAHCARRQQRGDLLPERARQA